MSSSEDETWIARFCCTKGNEFFCDVDEDYIEDRFNLTGLSDQVPNYSNALDTILDLEQDDKESEFLNQDVVEQSAEMLFGLIHARYILTNRGLEQMIDKWQRGNFGYCQRLYCEQQPVLPIGMSDVPGEATVKVYCPKCKDVYLPKYTRAKNIDGAYFGTGFPHMLFLYKPAFRPKAPTKKFVPTLYGFKIHPLAYQGNEKVETRAQSRDI